MVPAVSAFLFELLPDSSSESGAAFSTKTNHVVANGDALYDHFVNPNSVPQTERRTYALIRESTDSTRQDVGIANRASPTSVSDCFEFIAPAECLRLRSA